MNLNQSDRFNELRYKTLPKKIQELEQQLTSRLYQSDDFKGTSFALPKLENLYRAITKMGELLDEEEYYPKQIKKQYFREIETSESTVSILEKNEVKHHEKVQLISQFTLQAPYNNAHIYAATFLENETKVGLCLGSNYPFLIFDVSSQKLIKIIEFNGKSVLDAVESKGSIFLGCTKQLAYLDNNYQLIEHKFEAARDTPSRIYIEGGFIYACNYMSKLGDAGKIIQQWDKNAGKLSVYELDSRTSGCLAIDRDFLLAGDCNKKIIIWNCKNKERIKVLECMETITAIKVVSEGVIVGAGRSKFYVWQWMKSLVALNELPYQYELLNASCLLQLNGQLLSGDNDGSNIK